MALHRLEVEVVTRLPGTPRLKQGFFAGARGAGWVSTRTLPSGARLDTDQRVAFLEFLQDNLERTVLGAGYLLSSVHCLHQLTPKATMTNEILYLVKIHSHLSCRSYVETVS